MVIPVGPGLSDLVSVLSVNAHDEFTKWMSQWTHFKTWLAKLAKNLSDYSSLDTTPWHKGWIDFHRKEMTQFHSLVARSQSVPFQWISTFSTLVSTSNEDGLLALSKASLPSIPDTTQFTHEVLTPTHLRYYKKLIPWKFISSDVYHFALDIDGHPKVVTHSGVSDQFPLSTTSDYYIVYDDKTRITSYMKRGQVAPIKSVRIDPEQTCQQGDTISLIGTRRGLSGDNYVFIIFTPDMDYDVDPVEIPRGVHVHLTATTTTIFKFSSFEMIEIDENYQRRIFPLSIMLRDALSCSSLFLITDKHIILKAGSRELTILDKQ
jgi:hypothetical protein